MVASTCLICEHQTASGCLTYFLGKIYWPPLLSQCFCSSHFCSHSFHSGGLLLYLRKMTTDIRVKTLWWDLSNNVTRQAQPDNSLEAGYNCQDIHSRSQEVLKGMNDLNPQFQKALYYVPRKGIQSHVYNLSFSLQHKFSYKLTKLDCYSILFSLRTIY